MDIGLALAREEVRLGFLLYRSWGEGGGGGGGGVGGMKMKGLKKMGEKGSLNTHSRTAVPVLVSVVPVPKVRCMFFLEWYRYQ